MRKWLAFESGSNEFGRVALVGVRDVHKVVLEARAFRITDLHKRGP
jgi:hypothetical protein